MSVDPVCARDHGPMDGLEGGLQEANLFIHRYGRR